MDQYTRTSYIHDMNSMEQEPPLKVVFQPGLLGLVLGGVQDIIKRSKDYTGIHLNPTLVRKI